MQNLGGGGGGGGRGPGQTECIMGNWKIEDKYMKDYDPGKETSYIMYLDAYNLYGWTMSQALPFKWIAFRRICGKFKIRNYYRS